MVIVWWLCLYLAIFYYISVLTAFDIMLLHWSLYLKLKDSCPIILLQMFLLSFYLNVLLWRTILSRYLYAHSNLLQDPMISKMILSANNFGCSDEILTIAAFLSVQVRTSLRCFSFVCYLCTLYALGCSNLQLYWHYWFVQSVWVSMRGVKKEFDEAKLRFAAAEVCLINLLLTFLGSLISH